jgi:Flp pilus assembly protein TadD
MEQVSPYHVILTDALDGVHGDADGFARAQTAAQRMLAKPWDPEKASEIALVHNLLALIAMHTGDLAEADRQLTTAQALPGLLPAARTMIELNHCFLAIALKQPDQAATLLDETSKLGVRLTLPYLAEHLKLLGALIDWSRGNTAKAEAELRALLSEPPINVAVRHYLSQLLVAEGNKATASDLPVLAPPAPRPDRIEALAPDLFWVDPSHGGVTKRL